jgi:hypothetical protein
VIMVSETRCAQAAKLPRVANVVDDAEGQHRDTRHDQRFSEENCRGIDARDRRLRAQSRKRLDNRESKTDPSERGSHD